MILILASHVIAVVYRKFIPFIFLVDKVEAAPSQVHTHVRFLFDFLYIPFLSLLSLYPLISNPFLIFTHFQIHECLLNSSLSAALSLSSSSSSTSSATGHHQLMLPALLPSLHHCPLRFVTVIYSLEFYCSTRIQ